MPHQAPQPARRHADVAETIPAAPSPEALSAAEALSGLRTNQAAVAAALWGSR